MSLPAVSKGECDVFTGAVTGFCNNNFVRFVLWFGCPGGFCTGRGNGRYSECRNVSRLSIDECGQMRGIVQASVVCKSGLICARQDQNGEWYAVCVKKQN